ncbi:YbdD/YjiX family protein [Novosphingobium kaempferiae]|uniref:YbdD/YjiX family protein n=1 Tax=Novosphingobium kaempferiae TaxID=2896849 RepID=UPI001E5AF579|nr:YbdD/YjiX family protein [Novosphingobium kaempferiae]
MLRLMVGQPPYEAYLAHMAQHHPEKTPMTRVEFFRNREQARFGGAGGGKCC